jgi:hypothetical protein
MHFFCFWLCLFSWPFAWGNRLGGKKGDAAEKPSKYAVVFDYDETLFPAGYLLTHTGGNKQELMSKNKNQFPPLTQQALDDVDKNAATLIRTALELGTFFTVFFTVD